MQYSAALELLAPIPAQPHSKMSERYAFIDTRQVVSDMYDLGYELEGFRMPKSRSEKGLYGVQELDFRRPEDMKLSRTEAPRVIFMNSYNGSLSARLMSGLIRFACSNGIVLGDSIQKQRFIHIGDYEDQLLDHLKATHDRLEEVFARKTRFEEITLSPTAYQEMASRGIASRFNGKAIVDPVMALSPRREADLDNNLWTVWNRLQENLIRGGLIIENEKGVRESRAITSIQEESRVNRELWDLLEEFAELPNAPQKEFASV
jgi:hypothetical protein